MSKSDPESMHCLYCKLTNLNIPWTLQRLWPWECFCAKFTEADLRLVVAFMKEKQSKRHPVRSFNFRTFIAGPDSISIFEEDLAEARARSRIPVPTARSRILAATHRPEPAQTEARSVASILEGEKAFEQFRALKDNL